MRRLVGMSCVILGIGGVVIALAVHGISQIGIQTRNANTLSPGLHFDWVWHDAKTTPSTRMHGQNADPKQLRPTLEPKMVVSDVFTAITSPSQGTEASISGSRVLIRAPKPKSAPENASQALALKVNRLEADALGVEKSVQGEAEDLLSLRLNKSASQEVEYLDALDELEVELRKIKYEADLHAAIRRAEGDAFETRHQAEIHLDEQRLLAMRDQMRATAFKQHGATVYAQLDAIRDFKTPTILSKEFLPKDIRAFGGVHQWLDFFTATQADVPNQAP